MTALALIANKYRLQSTIFVQRGRKTNILHIQLGVLWLEMYMQVVTIKILTPHIILTHYWGPQDSERVTLLRV